MTGLAWTLVVLALFLGTAVGALAFRARSRREVMARTLVPSRTREVLAVMQSGAAIVRRDRRSAYCNHHATALGIARTDGALHPAVADLAEEAWRRGIPVEDDVEILRGVLHKSRTVHVRVTALDDELAFAVANDNTEARAAERARREFAINVSHELKTPVGAMSLLAESIEAAPEDEEMVREFAKKLRKESRRLTKLIQEIIEISRLQGGGSIVDRAEVRVEDVIDEAFDAARTAAEAKRIDMVLETAGDTVVLGDHDLLLMAVRNLIDNAVHYSDDGKRVTVTVGQTDDVVSIAVIDQGIGIAPKDQERVFERFYRVDEARSRDTGGTGLGLSIVKHVAKQHDGAVSLWSQAGVGSTFTIKLPAYGGEAVIIEESS